MVPPPVLTKPAGTIKHDVDPAVEYWLLGQVMGPSSMFGHLEPAGHVMQVFVESLLRL